MTNEQALQNLENIATLALRGGLIQDYNVAQAVIESVAYLKNKFQAEAELAPKKNGLQKVHAEN